MKDRALSAPSFSPPERLDEYRIVRELGRGAMGYVFLAEDTLLDRPVAVKFIAQKRPDEASKRRFFTEARAVAKLSHPNVVAVHRIGEAAGRLYLVTELVRGEALDTIDKPVSEDRLLAIASGVAKGLAAAHRSGVLHRDIKPANVMRTHEGEVKILDFGLAKISAGDADVVGSVVTRTAVSSSGDGVRGAVGSPLYMAPEVLAGGEATKRSDVYSMGVLLYELACGLAPRETLPDNAPDEAWIRGEAEPLTRRAPGIDHDLAAVIDRCLAPDPAARFDSAAELSEAIAALHAAAPYGAEVPEGNPYRGLTPFEAEHRALFFGRAADARMVIDKLRLERVVVVTGDSGVGKSSLCRAGVLPLIDGDVFGDGRVYKAITLVPGKRPSAALTGALGALAPSLAGEASNDPGALATAVRAALGADRGLVIFVDQLEELLTIAGEGEVLPFAAALAELSASVAGLRVLFAARGDYFTRLASLPEIGDDLLRGVVVLRPLSPEGLRAAIEGPAHKKGARFEPPSLVDDLVVAAGAGGGLPLLQFALAELWDARREGTDITKEALDAMGGVEGALARHADNVLMGLSVEARDAARHMLLRLITPEGTRIKRSRSELDAGTAPARAALEALVRGRLLVAGEGEGETSYELAHEALIRYWSTLRGWQEEGGARRAAVDRFEAAASEWDRIGRPLDMLPSGKRLDEAKALDRNDLTERARSFLDLALMRARRALMRQVAIGVAGPLAVGLAVLGARWKSARDLDKLIDGHVAEANHARTEGDHKRNEANEKRLRAYALFDAAAGTTLEEVSKKREEAERVWSEALESSKEAETKLIRAGQSLEAALALDPGRAQIRGAIGDVTMARIDLAEGFHAEERKADLVLRLGSYDPNGTRRKALSAAPLVSFVTSPPGATVSLERYEDKSGRKALVPVGTLGQTPLVDVPISGGPGSYRFVFRAAGRAEVLYPVLLRAGERFQGRVELLEASRVPAGYVVVPEGRFLMGSADAEALRKGLMTCPPLHEARTGAFLIAKHEVTFGEWMTYLDTLGDAERVKRTPLAKARIWGVELERDAKGIWHIVLTLNGNRLTATQGEPLRLSQRARRAEIRWENLPVSGVSLEDAEAYFAWLDTSGRVPGARLCDEREWERTARGADGRAFPHGDVLLQDDANFDQTYERKPLAFGPDEVGSHTTSMSPFGVLDMTGNVYEWVRSRGAASEAVMRGGSWYYDSLSDMIPNRTLGEAQTRDIGTGVRGCVDGSPAI